MSGAGAGRRGATGQVETSLVLIAMHCSAEGAFGRPSKRPRSVPGAW